MDIAKNDLLSLQNTQFIENRVQEEDETVECDNKIEESTKEKDEISKEDLKNAVSRGLEAINFYYDKVDIPASDSEDDYDLPKCV